MPRFPNLDTPFRKRARHLRTPLDAKFDPADWTNAFAAIAHPSPEDRQLLEAALWVGVEAKAHRLASIDLLSGFEPEQAIAMAVASINNSYRTSKKNRDAATEDIPADEPVSVDYLAHVRYENDHGQRMSAGDYLEASIDCLANWLYDARRLPTSPTVPKPSTAETSYRATYHYSLRRALKQLFDEALHEGARLDPDRVAHWVPHDSAIACLQKAWIIRAEADFMSSPMRLATLWRDFTPAERRKRSLSRSVDAVEWQGKGWQGKVRRRSYLSRRPDGRAMEREGIGDCYLALFFDEEMPLAPGLTASLLQDAWWVLTHFTRKVGAAVSGMAAPSLLQQAFAVEARELCGILRTALGVSDACAKDIVAFLTFREAGARLADHAGAPKAEKGDRGLWSAPLVAISDGVLLLPSAIFEITMPVYRIESWLERGGIDDQALEHRGDRYEVSCRVRLAAALGENDNLPGARFAHQGIAKTEDFPHQTDLLFMIGNRAFVGEIKCWLTPADPHHWGRFYRVRVLDAARQAIARAVALREHREFLANALGIEVDAAHDLEICPIVVTNLIAGFSLSYEGCRIIEAEFLRYYLRGGSMGGSVAVWRGRPAAQKLEFLYGSEAEASERFDDIMADPWSLRRFLDRMSCEDVAYPRPTGGQYSIEARFRGNLTEAERWEHAEMLQFAANPAPPEFGSTD